METAISRAEFDAYKEKCDTEHKRLEDEDRRQNRRIDSLEGAMKEISNMSAGVRELAVEMKNMCEVQKLQGKRLETLEARDGENWRKAVWYLVTAVAGAVLGVLFSKMGL